MKTEVANLVNYSAKRILDQFLANGHTLETSHPFLAEEIFKDLKSGETKDIIFNNLEEFNSELNKVIWNRITYLVDEGFVEHRGSTIHARTEQEIEEFINLEVSNNCEDDFPF